MSEFPRTEVGGVSMPRMIIGSNWLLGYSHTSKAKDAFIRDYMTPERMADIIVAFLEHGIDALMCIPVPEIVEAMDRARDRTGRDIILVATPHFSPLPGGPPEMEPERVFDEMKEKGATFCFPHQCVTDAILDRLHRTLRGMDQYSAMIRERGMIPGLSTHAPEAVVIADESGADVESYIQLYNAAGFMMQLEADWVTRIIHNAKKPVMTIKPLGAGRLLPTVGLAFVWSTLRDCDMVTIGVSSPDEAREDIEISRALLEKRAPDVELQRTRSKQGLS